MTFTSPHIGQRIRAFRQLKGFTQQQLELELEASFGHLSKIESGKVNPTKETILHIAQLLDLNKNETGLLLGLTLEPVSEEQIKKALAYTADYLASSSNPVYITDDFWFIWAANNAMLDVIGIPNDRQIREQILQQNWGSHTLQWLFDPKFGFRQLIAYDTWEKMVIEHCIFFINQTYFKFRQHQQWASGLLTKLSNCPGFKEIWQYALTQATLNNFTRYDFTITFEVQSQKIKYFMNEMHIDATPRFIIIDYLPQQPK